jgi:uncharacterized protein YecT (DUF1311 family)
MRKHVLLKAMAVSLVMAPGAVNAANSPSVEKRYSNDYTDCLYNGDNRTDFCAASEYEIQDGRLNQAYVMVMKRQSKAGKAKLRGLQRAWIGKRDANCKKSATAANVDIECKVDETIARTIWLEQYR